MLTTPSLISSMPSRLLFASLVAVAASAGAQVTLPVATSASTPDSSAARDSACAFVSFKAFAQATPDCTRSARASQERALSGEAWARVGATISVAAIAAALVAIHSNVAAIPRSFELAGPQQLDLMSASARDSTNDGSVLPAQVFSATIASLEGWTWDWNQDISDNANRVTGQFATGLSLGLQNLFASALGTSGGAQNTVFQHAISNGDPFRWRTGTVHDDPWSRGQDWGRDHGRTEGLSDGAPMTATPEPATLALTASGLAALVGYARRRRTGAT